MHGTFAVARKGRKRKMRARHPGGQLIDEDRISPSAIAAQMPHRAWLPKEVRLDQRAESPLGRLALTGRISRGQYLAGRRYASIVAKYKIIIDAPGSPKSIAGIMEPRSGSGGLLPDSIARARKQAYDAAFEALGNAGQKAQRAVARIAVNDQPCSVEDVGPLKDGLAELERYFGRIDHGK